MKWFFVLFAAIAALVYTGTGGFRIYKEVEFGINAGDYLKQAGDANTVEIAATSLGKAVAYAEANNLTSGNTSPLWQSPSNDVAFWYSNLKASLTELENISPGASQLEKTNVLMKLRESLLDQGKSTSVTTPDGIAVHPMNQTMFWVLWISGVCFAIFGLGAVMLSND
jgi:hypothetical protein